MRWFRRKQRDSSLFIVQDDGRFGHVQEAEGVPVLDDIVGEESVDYSVEGRQFLGLTITRQRFRLGAIFLVCLFLLLLGRAAHLQIIQGDHYLGLAEGNRVRTQVIVPPRGIITDRRGTVLAENVPSFVLTMTIADIPTEPEERESVLARVADLAGLQRTDIDLLITDYAQTPYDPVPLKKGIAYETAMRLAIETASLPGFGLDTSPKRRYESSASSLSHILGYVGKMSEGDYEEWQGRGYRRVDDIGKAGIERGAESLLRGVPGAISVEVDALGNEIALVNRQEPVPGANLTLSIDLTLQDFIQEVLEETFAATGTSRGSVVAIDPRSGEIRAMVGLPSYDSNSFAAGIDTDTYTRLIEDEDKPLFPRAYAGEFPSGSTFKPFVAYAALKEGVVSERTTFYSTGGVGIGPWFFPDWKYGGHGYTDVRKAIAESVNTYFYIVGGGFEDTTGLGVNRIARYASQFGFGEPTGVLLPGEADGFLPSKQWKLEAKNERWYVGDTYNLSIGQGDLLVTPLQMALATGMIANGGKSLSPRLIQAIDGGVGDVLFTDEPQAPFDPYITQVIREGMRLTVTKGSARSLSLIEMDIAGKTGTAQNIGNRPTHAWFTGFAPYKNPTLALAIIVEEGGEGSAVAVPLAARIFEWWQYFGE